MKKYIKNLALACSLVIVSPAFFHIAAKQVNGGVFYDGNFKFTQISGTTNVSCSGFNTGITELHNPEIPATASNGRTEFTVTEINYAAFSEQKGLTGTLTLPNTITTISEAAFNNCTGLTGTLVLPENLINIEAAAFQGCSNLTGTLEIPSNVTIVDRAAFSSCAGFTKLTLNEGLVTIANSAFYYCSGLKGNLEIPSTVTTIGQQAFAYCSGFTGDLTIPANVTSLATHTFFGCTGLDGTVNISADITQVPSSILSGCANIKSVVLTDKITSVGSSAFNGCTSLTSFYCPATNPPTATNSMIFTSSIYEPCTLYVPSGSINDYKDKSSLNVWKNFYNVMAIDDATTKVNLLVIYPDGGSITSTLAYGENYSVYITPFMGYKINTVTRNDMVITTELSSDGLYTYSEAGGAQEAQVIKFTIETTDEGPTTGAQDITTSANPLKVYTIGLTLHVDNAETFEMITVTNINGQVVAHTANKMVDLGAPGVYIVKVGSRTFKVMAL